MAEVLQATGTAPELPKRFRGSSFSIGRLHGIDVRVHLTFFLLVGLFVIGSTGRDGQGPVAAVVWLGLIFSCVLVHELAHSVVAQGRGVGVHEIMLLPIGGVSRMESLPETPRDEFAISIVGPVASVGLAALAGMFALVFNHSLVPVDLADGALLHRLFWFNLAIAVFNMIPAFPLDGGRVFRALLERRYDLEGATRIAARVGRALAITLIAISPFVNLWLLVIGVFVYMGGTAEEQAVIVHQRLRGLRVQDVMVLNPVTIDARSTGAELTATLRHSTQRVFPVVDGTGVVGILDADVLANTPGNADLRAGNLASPVLMLEPGADVERRALPLILESPAGALVVVEHGAIVGLLRREELQRLLRA